MFGFSSKKSSAAAAPVQAPAAARHRGLRGSVCAGDSDSKIRGNAKSFGRVITEAGIPASRSAAYDGPLAPRTQVDFFDMVRRFKAQSKTDFTLAEFAWWWKLMVAEEDTCFQAAVWLLDPAVTHLKAGKGLSQDALALIGNSVALLFLYGYLNLSERATTSSIERHAELFKLTSEFDDKEARDRTQVEMCVVDLIGKIR